MAVTSTTAGAPDHEGETAALLASAERLRLATRAAGLCLWDYSVRDDTLDWTEECRSLFGLAPDAQPTHAEFLAAVHPADRERIARAIDLAFHEYAEYEVEFRIVRPDGAERWIYAVGDCVYDPLGRAERFLGVMIDISDRKRGEAALRESEARFRELAESIDDVFWIYDAPAGRPTYVSPAYSALFGQDPQELYRDPDAWLRNVHVEDRARMRQAYAPDSPTREFTHEYRIDAPGGVRWARDRGVVVRDAGGRPLRVVGITQDITDSRRVAEVVREAECRRNEFLAHLANELRGPLGGLADAVAVLGAAAGGRGDLKRVHDTLAREFDQLARLVDDLFKLMRRG